MKKLLTATLLILSVFLLIKTQTNAQISTGLVGYWTFDEGSGNTAGDSAGSNTGTLVNNPTWLTGANAKVGNGAMSFDGVNDYVDLGQPSTLDMSTTNAFTISTWIYPTVDNISDDKIVFNRGAVRTSPDIGAYGLYRYAFSPRWGAEVTDGTTRIIALSSNGDLTLNTWQHIVVTWNGSTKTLTIYKDKAGIASATDGTFTTLWDGGGTSVNRDTAIGIQGRNKPLSTSFPGTIDEVRIYNRVLSTIEISQLYDLGFGGGATVTPTTCTSFTYSAWSSCTNSSQTRTVTSSLPLSCTGGTPITTQSCSVTATTTPPIVQTGTCSTISQYGITWTFDKAYSCGQFVNGDWWVVGPVVIDSVNPGWDGSRNGSMLDPSANGTQGYDSRINSYYPFNDNVRVKFPLTISSGNHSLVSVIGLNQNKIGGAYEALDTAVVLTITNNTISNGTFRPQYTSGTKTFYNTNQVNYNLLPSLSIPTGVSLPDYSGIMTRVWLDHGPQVWGTTIHPVTSLPAYPRDSAEQVSEMSLLALLNIPARTSIVNRLIQLGIDQYGVVLQNGDAFSANGGFGSGRKWPILFAGILLNDSNLKNPPLTTLSHSTGLVVQKFGEDGQTYYYNDISLPLTDVYGFSERNTKNWFNNTSGLWRITDDSYYKLEYQHKNPQYWTSDGRGHNWISPTGITIQDPPSGSNSDYRSESYRQCCTSYTWVGEALAARIMNAQSIWNHPAFFDYVDTWMLPKDSSFWNTVLNYETVSNMGSNDYQGSSLSPFVDAMWESYRNNSTTVTPPTPIIGDFNNDRLVNSLDFSLLVSAWNQNNATYDINHDGIVNSLDYVVMVQNWTQ